MITQTLSGAWEFHQKNEPQWLPATVPGGVHTDLLALGRIPDPFVGDNEKRVQWVAQQDWEYQHRFDVDAELFEQPQVWLTCDGLDTLATVFLNGHELGQTANMFRQYRWDVKSLLKPSENEIRILFASAVEYVAGKQAVRYLPGVSQAISGGPYIRKAPCQFGWDWGPQLPPIGIWKDIRLEGYQNVRIEDVHLRQIHREGQVHVQASLQAQSWGQTAGTVEMQITGPDGTHFQSAGNLSADGHAVLGITIAEPQLWWPNSYGDQPLYQVSLTVKQGAVTLDRRDYQLGLRTIELRQEPDEWGQSFTFFVNGQKMFAKGSDWIPADSFPTRVSLAQLESLLQSAVDTHQNMLRVWGGGFYEDERFYDICDRLGILIWQDFVFSCSVYPFNDPEFLDNVRVEVVENVRRLRHRASLALWCGNNEMEQGWVEWGWKGPEYKDLKAAYELFFYHTLPAWCATEDPDHAYWPSSPSSNEPFDNPNSQVKGDTHYWDVWHGRKPFIAYRSQFPRFMSEFGFQSLPPMETIRTFAPESEWNMTSYIMERHQKNDSGNQLMVAQMLDTFRLPKDFESLVYLSLVLQAEGIRYGVEHWRRNIQRVSGIIYWQLNDCWPVASWSSLDYYGRWKALHYAARRFYAPLMLSIEDHPTSQAVFITNEGRETWEGSVQWSLETLDGKTLEANTIEVNAAPGAVTPVGNLDFTQQLKEDVARDRVFIAEQWQSDRLVSRQTAFFVPTKHLNLSDPQITCQVKLVDGQAQISLTAQSLARLVECTLDGADVVFSDNYFDLPAGRTFSITCPLPNGWTEEKVRSALKVRSVYDSYAHGG